MERLDYLTEKDDRQVGDHLYRYWLSCQEKGDNISVVDAGCGLGFGSELLAKYYNSVFAVDYCGQCLEDLFSRSAKNIYTMEADLNFDKLPPADVLVAFEVIEHLQFPINLVNQFQNYKKVILSTPIIPTTKTNNFHKQDFTEQIVMSWFKGFNIKWVKKQHDDVYLIVCAEK